MSLKTEWVRYGAAQEFSGYAAWPETATPLPAVIVLQEAWGVDAHIEDVTNRFALAGYVAFAPDLFAHNGARHEHFTRERMAELLSFMNSAPPAVWMDPKVREAELAKRTAEVAQRIGESLGTLGGKGMQLPQYVPHVTGASHFLRHDFAPSKGQKVAALGFCMGGGVAGLLASHDPELAGAAIFYGSGPADELVANIQCPVLGFYGSLDKRLIDALPAFTESMKKHGKRFEPHVYEATQHAFFNDRRPSYGIAATRDSFVRVLEFLREVLT